MMGWIEWWMEVFQFWVVVWIMLGTLFASAYLLFRKLFKSMVTLDSVEDYADRLEVAKWTYDRSLVDEAVSDTGPLFNARATVTLSSICDYCGRSAGTNVFGGCGYCGGPRIQ